MTSGNLSNHENLPSSSETDAGVKSTSRKEITSDFLLSWIDRADGLLLPPDQSVALSIPFVRKKTFGSGQSIEAYVPRSKSTIMTALRSHSSARVIYRVAEFYIDPHWIRRPPHAPTETKLTFEIQGSLSELNFGAAEALNHLDRVRRSRQAEHRVSSPFRIEQLDPSYAAQYLSEICFFSLKIERISIHQCQALQHLDRIFRERVLKHLEARTDISARQSLDLIRYFL